MENRGIYIFASRFHTFHKICLHNDATHWLTNITTARGDRILNQVLQFQNLWEVCSSSYDCDRAGETVVYKWQDTTLALSAYTGRAWRHVCPDVTRVTRTVRSESISEARNAWRRIIWWKADRVNSGHLVQPLRTTNQFIIHLRLIATEDVFLTSIYCSCGLWN